MAPASSRVTIRLSPARSARKKSPARGTLSSRPTQSHCVAKIMRRSRSNVSGETYHAAGRVFASAPTLGLTNAGVALLVVGCEVVCGVALMHEEARGQRRFDIHPLRRRLIEVKAIRSRRGGAFIGRRHLR